MYKYKKKGGILFLSCILAILVWHSTGNLSIFPKNTSPMVDFVVRSAFVDTRPRNGYKNSTVIFAEVSKNVLKFGLILGCGVDTIYAEAYKVESLYSLYVWWNYGHLTHEDIMITCYDLKAHENSTSFIAYHPATNSINISIVTVEITYSPIRKDSKSRTVVCTLAFGKPPWLKEWLLYQKTIGVDLVHMYVEETFLNDNENQKIIKDFVGKGLQVDYRKTYFNSTQIYYYSQFLIYNDCLYRYQGVYEYALFLDTDDFFIPRLPNKTSVLYYLNRFLPKENQATVTFHWLTLFPDCGLTQPKASAKDGNVTQLLKVKQYSDTSNFKFACRPHLITLVSVHTALAYTKTAIAVPTANSKIAYVGHFRLDMFEIDPLFTCDNYNSS